MEAGYPYPEERKGLSFLLRKKKKGHLLPLRGGKEKTVVIFGGGMGEEGKSNIGLQRKKGLSGRKEGRQIGGYYAGSCGRS